jgi:HK97 gp10 family phage protein
MSTVQVKGLREINDFLQKLPAKLEANVLRGALRAGANVVLESAKANVPVDTGTLRDGLKVSTRSRRGVVMARVVTTGKHAYLARWIEYGTTAHRIVARGKGMYFGGMFAKGVNHPGGRPKPFMRPALDARARDAVVAAAEYMKKRLATKHGLTGAAGVEIA